MLFRILGLSDKYLLRWSKASGYAAIFIGIFCIIFGFYIFKESNEAESKVIPIVKKISVNLHNLQLDKQNEKITVEYASKFMLSHAEDFYRFWGYFGYLCIAAGMISIFQGVMYFKLNSVITSPSYTEKAN